MFTYDNCCKFSTYGGKAAPEDDQQLSDGGAPRRTRSSCAHIYGHRSFTYCTTEQGAEDLCCLLGSYSAGLLGHTGGGYIVEADGSQRQDLAVMMSPSDRFFIESVYAANKHLCNILELGTGSGVFSINLGLMAALRGPNCTFTTFDVVDRIHHDVKRAWLPNMVLQLGDLDGGVNPAVVRAMAPSDSLILVDGGSKGAEFLLYTRAAHAQNPQSDHVFVVHDWGDSWSHNWFASSLESTGLEMAYEDTAQRLGSMARAYKRHR
jgi:hypothetical protein